MHLRAEQVNISVLSALKSISVFGPIVVEIEGDRLFLVSLLVFDDVGETFPKAFEGFRRRDVELSPQRVVLQIKS